LTRRAAPVPAGGPGPSLLPLALVFAVSGCAGLFQEVAWARALGQSLGSSLAALTAVLAAFLGGLGLGSALGAGALADRSRDPLRLYALLEGLLAIGGLAAPLIVSALPRVLSIAGPACGSDRLLALLRLALAVAALLPCALLMGATFPCLVRAALRRAPVPGTTVATLCGANALGAAAGALLGSFASLPGLGTRGTFLLAAGLNALAASAALVLARREPARPSPAAAPAGEAASVVPDVRRTADAPLLLVAALLSGMVGAVLQVGWTRVAALAFGSTVYALGTTLATYILGLGLGPLLVRRRLGSGDPLRTSALALGGVGLSSLVLVPILGRLPLVAALLSGWLEPPPLTLLLLQFAVLLALLAIPAMAQGAVFPALTALASGSPSDAHRPAARLYAASTWGSVLGFVLAGFVTLPHLGTRRSLIAASTMSLVLAALVWRSRPARWSAVAAGALGLVVLALGISALLPGWETDLVSGGGVLYGPVYRAASGGRGRVREWMRRRGEVLYAREDGVGMVTVRRSPTGVLSLQINCKTEASTGGDMSTQLLSAHLPLLLHPSPGKALVIGLASGITLGAAERHPLRSIEVIEIAPAVLAAARLFDPWSGRALDDGRVRVVVDDARGRLLARPDRYDVIASQPSNPWVAGVSNLFTVEFYRLVRSRLNAGGLFCQWVQAYRLSPDDFRGIVASFLQVFPDATLWEESAGGGDYFLLGGDAPLRIDPARLVPEERRAAWDDLRRGGVDDVVDLLTRFVSGPDGLRLLAEGARLHTDDNPYLETHAPLTMFRDTLRGQIALLRRVRQPVFAVLPEGIAAREPDLAERLRAAVRRRDRRLEIAAGLKEADLWSLTDPWLAAGIAALRGGLLPEAIEALSRATAANPQSGTSSYLLGESYRAAGLADAAAVAYAESVRRDPELAPAWNALGRSFLERGETEKGEAAFERALGLDPALAEARNNLGTVRLQKGRTDEAEALFRRALEDDPDLGPAQANLGLILKRRGDAAAAEEAYRAALRIDPLNTDARYNLAVLLKENGRRDAARRELTELLSVDPADPGAIALFRDLRGP